MSCLIVFRSMTQAQNAAAVLCKNGVSAVMVKPPTSLGRGSCAHSVAVQPAYLAGSLQLLKKTSLSPLGLYEQTSDGWREVLL